MGRAGFQVRALAARRNCRKVSRRVDAKLHSVCVLMCVRVCVRVLAMAAVLGPCPGSMGGGCSRVRTERLPWECLITTHVRTDYAVYPAGRLRGAAHSERTNERPFRETHRSDLAE